MRSCGPAILESLEIAGKGLENTEFQQDNARPHTAKKTMEWFEENGISLLKWPSKSPDMNPIEHLWSDMARRIREYPVARSCDELWEQVQEVWEATPYSYLFNLIDSLPRRMQALIDARGGYTKY